MNLEVLCFQQAEQIGIAVFAHFKQEPNNRKRFCLNSLAAVDGETSPPLKPARSPKKHIARFRAMAGNLWSPLPRRLTDIVKGSSVLQALPHKVVPYTEHLQRVD